MWAQVRRVGVQSSCLLGLEGVEYLVILESGGMEAGFISRILLSINGYSN